MSRAFAAGVAGKLTVAFDAVDGAASEAREVGDAFTEARALLVNGVLWLWEGKPNESRTSLRASLDLAWANGFAALADRCGRWLVQADVEAGNDEAALELAAPLLARADERGDPSVAVGVRASLAELWRERGDVDRARTLASDAVEIATERSVAIDAAAEAHLTLAAAALDADEPACVELVPMTQTVRQSHKPTISRPDPTFVTHLIATADHAPQTRSLRRASPADAQTAYGASQTRCYGTGLRTRL